MTESGAGRPFYCRASNIKLKIFEKLNFDVYKIKDAQSNNGGLLSGSHRGVAAQLLFRLLMAARNATERRGEKKKGGRATGRERKHCGDGCGVVGVRVCGGGAPLEASSISCDHT